MDREALSRPATETTLIVSTHIEGMSTLDNKFSGDLLKLSLKDYFNRLETSIDDSINLKSITNFFTIKTFTERKPYLTRRQLIPIDGRFNNIEIVYDDDKNVKAIVWEFKITLKDLKDFFGEPIVHNVPYDNSTEFAFKSKNQKIEIIKTRYNGWLTKSENANEFELESDRNKKLKLDNPEFNFIQFSLTD